MSGVFPDLARGSFPSRKTAKQHRCPSSRPAPPHPRRPTPTVSETRPPTPFSSPAQRRLLLTGNVPTQTAGRDAGSPGDSLTQRDGLWPRAAGGAFGRGLQGLKSLAAPIRPAVAGLTPRRTRQTFQRSTAQAHSSRPASGRPGRPRPVSCTEASRGGLGQPPARRPTGALPGPADLPHRGRPGRTGPASCTEAGLVRLTPSRGFPPSRQNTQSEINQT